MEQVDLFKTRAIIGEQGLQRLIGIPALRPMKVSSTSTIEPEPPIGAKPPARRKDNRRALSSLSCDSARGPQASNISTPVTLNRIHFDNLHHP